MAAQEISQHLAASVKPELWHELQGLHISSHTKKEAGTTASQKVFEDTLKKNLESFLCELEHSESKIDQDFAQIYRPVWEEHQKETDFLKGKIQSMLTSFMEIAVKLSGNGMNEHELSQKISEAITPLNDCEQLITELARKVPPDLEPYQMFLKLHAGVMKKLSSVKQEADEHCQKLRVAFLSPQRDLKANLEKHLSPIFETSIHSLYSLNIERWMARSLRVLSSVPIEAYTKPLGELKALLLPQTKLQKEGLKEFIDVILTLQKNEPWLKKKCTDLSDILIKTPLKKDKAVDATQRLLDLLNGRVRTIFKRSFEISGSPTPISEKPPTEPKCWVCSSETGQNQTELLRCSGCKVAFYCSRECQKNDWLVHRCFCPSVQHEARETST